ncbi:MAG TPA: sigma-70 family RNA polymerase sigma factor [Bryobacterales bacterium]|nr:sigma-70 family RNA polymerase sigma factor [Bryobacterales bacterium]
MEESDGAAVARARAGDEDGFRVLVERHSRSIFRLAYRMTGNEHDAEDVVQETFLRAYKRLDRFEERSSFNTWLYRIASNCALDLMRARQREEERREPAGRRASAEDYAAAMLAFPADGPTPERLAFSSEVRQRVAAALEELSPMERAAFVLRHFEGMSIEEIGRALDRHADAAKNCVFRAVHKLRRALEPVVSSTKCNT